MNLLSEVKTEWTQLGYGMFVHFGINTFTGVAWGDGLSDPKIFNPSQLDVQQWADVAVRSGMKYAVLTAKHHDGFCLWPSKHTEYSVKNAACSIDIVREFTESFRSSGIKVGLYYSLWDCNCKYYNNDEKYAGYMKLQLEELLTEYGEILELWFDGGWDKDSPTQSWTYQASADDEVIDGRRWSWREIYNFIHSIQPNCLVVQNSSSNNPGKVKYMPVDIRTSEHYDFIFNEKLCFPEQNDIVVDKDENKRHKLPIEFCTTLTPDWFWKKDSCYSHPSAVCIADWRQRANQLSGNLLLNIGPNNSGQIPEYHEDFLTKANEIYQQSSGIYQP